jgi:hypothetical protein
MYGVGLMSLKSRSERLLANKHKAQSGGVGTVVTSSPLLPFNSLLLAENISLSFAFPQPGKQTQIKCQKGIIVHRQFLVPEDYFLLNTPSLRIIRDSESTYTPRGAFLALLPPAFLSNKLDQPIPHALHFLDLRINWVS